MSGRFQTSRSTGVPGGRNLVGELPTWALMAPFIGVLIAEGYLFFGFTYLALASHLVILLFCVVVPFRYESTSVILHPFSLLPLFRIINLGMPTFFEMTLQFFPLTYLPMLPALYLVARSQKIRINVNPNAFLLGFGTIAVLSFPLALVEFTIIQPEALIPELSVFWLVVLAIIMLGTVGLVEEILFRGILQRRFGELLGRWVGVVLASLLFASMHSIYGSTLELVFVFFLGILLGVLYEWTDSIGLVIGLHGTLNVFLFGLIPLYEAGMLDELLTSILLLL